ncbi:MAG: hypothetical protein HIU81_11650 [Acidobacteria bacterium]|nr:hypothetical protein [Acidobacteriota bacterium]
MTDLSAAPRVAAREKRWLVLAEDGRHITLGRHSNPSDEEVLDVSQQLNGMGLAGWLAISEGGYYSTNAVTLLMVRQITDKLGDWTLAESRWNEQRMKATR